jgi:hypothetical protein
VSTAVVVQAYRFALDPTPTQVRDLDRHAGAARFAFNWALAAVKANIAQRSAERSYGLDGDDLTARERVSDVEGRVDQFRRRDGEEVAAFATRIADGDADERSVAIGTPAALAFVYHADLPVADGAEVYALHRAGLNADTVRLLAAEDLAGQLAPMDRLAV